MVLFLSGGPSVTAGAHGARARALLSREEPLFAHLGAFLLLCIGMGILGWAAS